MGLDMHLCRGKKIPKKSFEETMKINDLIENYDNEDLIKTYKKYIFDCGVYSHWKSLIKEVVYWRKANQIHNWFVTNVQGGNDNCQEYEVSKEQIEELRDLCIEVLYTAKLEPAEVTNGYSITKGENGEIIKTPNLENGIVITNGDEISELLPTSSGFFFGSTDYDQWYLEDIKHTIAELNKVLKETDFEKEYLVYRSSW